MKSISGLAKASLAQSTRALLAGGIHASSVSPLALQLPGSARLASSQGQQATCTVRDAINQGLAEEMDSNDKVFIMGEEVAQYQGAYKVTRGLLDRFGPQRVVDSPITEMGFTGLCVGAAMAGLVPVCEFMTFNFAMQAIDQIINSAAKSHYMSGGVISANVVFRGPNGFAAGVAGQHSQDYAPWYGSIPGLKVVSPYSAEDAKGLIKAAIRDPNPVVMLENELMYGESFPVSEEFHSADFTVPIGKAKVEIPGTDVTLISHSYQLRHCFDAAKILKEQYNISAEVLNLRSIKPLDVPAIVESIKKTNRAVVVESAFPGFGLGSEICGQVSETEAWDYLDAPIMRVTGAEVPTPYYQELEAMSFPNADVVVKAARQVLYLDEEN